MWKSPNRAKAFKSKNFNRFVGDQAGQYQIEVKRNPKTELWPCPMRAEIKPAMWKKRAPAQREHLAWIDPRIGPIRMPDCPHSCHNEGPGLVRACQGMQSRAQRLPDSPALIPRLTITIRLRVIFTGMSSTNYGPIVPPSQVKCPQPATLMERINDSEFGPVVVSLCYSVSSPGCPRTTSWPSLPSPPAAAPSPRWPTSSTGTAWTASTCPWPPWTRRVCTTPWATPPTPTCLGRPTGSSGERGPPSPGPSWTSSSPCSRRRGTRTSSCGRRWRSKSICQNPEFR